MGSAEPESGNRSMIPRWNMGAWAIEKGIGTLPVEVSVGFFVIPSWNLSATAIVICQWLRDCMKWIMFCWAVDLKCAVMRWASFKPRRRGHEASPSEEEPVLRIEDQRFGGLGLQSPSNELHDQLKFSQCQIPIQLDEHFQWFNNFRMTRRSWEWCVLHSRSLSIPVFPVSTNMRITSW